MKRTENRIISLIYSFLMLGAISLLISSCGTNYEKAAEEFIAQLKDPSSAFICQKDDNPSKVFYLEERYDEDNGQDCNVLNCYDLKTKTETVIDDYVENIIKSEGDTILYCRAKSYYVPMYRDETSEEEYEGPYKEESCYSIIEYDVESGTKKNVIDWSKGPVFCLLNKFVLLDGYPFYDGVHRIYVSDYKSGNLDELQFISKDGGHVDITEYDWLSFPMSDNLRGSRFPILCSKRDKYDLFIYSSLFTEENTAKEYVHGAIGFDDENIYTIREGQLCVYSFLGKEVKTIPSAKQYASRNIPSGDVVAIFNDASFNFPAQIIYYKTKKGSFADYTTLSYRNVITNESFDYDYLNINNEKISVTVSNALVNQNKKTVMGIASYIDGYYLIQIQQDGRVRIIAQGKYIRSSSKYYEVTSRNDSTEYYNLDGELVPPSEAQINSYLDSLFDLF